jgi:hypothetical protein
MWINRLGCEIRGIGEPVCGNREGIVKWEANVAVYRVSLVEKK